MPATTTPEETTARSWELWLKPCPTSAGEARRGARETATRWGVPDDATDTVVLIVSELVTNAIRHCDKRHLVLLCLLDDGETVTVEVSDPNARMPRPVVASQTAESGRGLFLVRAAAAELGARPRRPVGKTVWARVSIADAAQGEQ